MRAGGGAAGAKWDPRRAGGRVPSRVERFDRRGTEPFGPFTPFEPFEPFEFLQNSGIFPRKFKNFQKISTFSKLSAKFRQNASKSEQKSVNRIQK